jgi:hypothetical protein
VLIHSRRNSALRFLRRVDADPGDHLGHQLADHADLTEQRMRRRLRQLAYTMPGRGEDPLIRLSELMVRYAAQKGPER